MPIWVCNQILITKKNKIKTNKLLIMAWHIKKILRILEITSIDIMRKFINKKFHVEFYDPYVKI